MQGDASVIKRSAWLILGACVALPGPVQAASCSVTVGNIAFGNYDVFNRVDTATTGTVKVKCAASASFTISLSAGTGTFAARVLTSGSYKLDYNLFTTSQDLTIWGDGTSGTATVSASGTGASYTVYGLIPALQNVPVGSYSDTITVTVTY